MYWYIISLLLGLTYTSYMVYSQYINTKYKTLSPTTIFVNAICIAAFLCVIAFPRHIIIPEWSPKYGLIILIASCLFFQNFLLQIGTHMSFNMGMIDAFAICIYLPLITFILYMCFGEKVTLRKGIGIALACLGGYFILI